MATTTEPFGNHPKEWEPTSKDVPSEAVRDLESVAKVMALKPTQADMRAAFGEPKDEGKSVRWTVDRRKDPKAWARWKEISAPHRRAEIERSYEWNGSHRKVQVVDPDTGRRELIFEEHEDAIGRKRGLRRDRPYARMPKLMPGPDGMLFRNLSDSKGYPWMPTGRTCLGTPLDGRDPFASGPQRDPYGETWVEMDGQWLRMQIDVNEDEAVLRFVREG